MSALSTDTAPRGVSLMTRIASRYGVDADKMAATLKATAFATPGKTITNEQLMALCILADQYRLNPFTKEIYAFPDKGGIVPVVGIDGWVRIANEHPELDGFEYRYADETSGPKSTPVWIECIVHRKDREHPTVAREYLAECQRGSAPWSSHPSRMLRHKATIQALRLAFGFAGIYDADEARDIVRNREPVTLSAAPELPAALASDEPPVDMDPETGEVAGPEEQSAVALSDVVMMYETATTPEELAQADELADGCWVPRGDERVAPNARERSRLEKAAAEARERVGGEG